MKFGLMVVLSRLLLCGFQGDTDAAKQRDIDRDLRIAERFAPVFYQALGPSPRFDYITRFDFDGDWRGDNNWANAADTRFPLTASVYYAVIETRTHYFVHYAVFHPRDYKGGQHGTLLSELLRVGVLLGGDYDPTGRAAEAVLAHENDLEGVLVVATKDGADVSTARPMIVETLAHNSFLRYVPSGSSLTGSPVKSEMSQPILFIESMGHGIQAWRDDSAQRRMARNGFLVYRYTGTADTPDRRSGQNVGYDLVPLLTSLWPRAQGGVNETYGEAHDYGALEVRVVERCTEVQRAAKVGLAGSAFRGFVGAAHMARPPWGWFDGFARERPLGEWFLQPAETIQRRWEPGESFSTTYTYHPFIGVNRGDRCTE
jgi:hypothetical protein